MAKIGSITDKAKEQAKKKKPGTTIDSLLGGKKQGSGLLSGKKQSGGILSGKKSQGSGLLSGGAQPQPNDAYQAAIAKLLGGVNNGISAGLNRMPQPNIQIPQPTGFTQPQGMNQPGGMPNYAQNLMNRNLGGGKTQGIQLPGTQNLQGIVPAAQTGGSADYVRKVLGMSSNINQPQRTENRMQTVQTQGITAPSMHTTSNNYAGNVAGNGKQQEEVKPVSPVAGAPAGNTAPKYDGPTLEEAQKQQNAAEMNSAMRDYVNRYRGNVDVHNEKADKWKPVNISAQDMLRRKEAEGLGVPESSLPYMRQSKGLEIRADQWEKNKPQQRDTNEFGTWFLEGVRLGKLPTNTKDTVILSTTKDLEESIPYIEEQLKQAEEYLKNPEERPVQPIMPTAGLEFNVAQNMNSGIFDEFRAADEQWKKDEARWQYLYNGGYYDELTEQLEMTRAELARRQEIALLAQEKQIDGKFDRRYLPKSVRVAYQSKETARNVDMSDADYIYIHANHPEAPLYGIKDTYSKYGTAFLMPDDAREQFNILYKAGDYDGAMEVFERWEPLMEEMRDYNTQERAKEEAHGNLGWLKSLLTVPINAGLGVLAPAQALASLISGEDLSRGSQQHKWSVSTAATRQESIKMAGDWFAERFGEDARHWGEFAMSTSYSILDNMYLMGVSKIGTRGWTPEQIQQGCSNFVLGMMFGEATGTVFTDQIQKGRSPREAAVMALGSGAIEVLTERVTIENYMNIESIASLKNLLKSGIAEASEEFAAELLDAQLDIACSVIWQHKNEIEEMAEGYFQQYYDQYLKEGMSEEEARQAASKKASEATFNSFAGRLGEAALGGFVSAGPLGAFSAIGSTVNQNRVGGAILSQQNNRQNIEELLTTVENNNPGKSEQKLARQIREDLNNNKELKKGKLGKLYQLAMQNAPAKIRNIYQESYTEVINDELERRGLKGEQIEELGPIVAKAALNEIKSLTPSERIALHRNETAANLMMELTEEMGQENKLLQEANEKAMRRSQGAMEIEQAAMKAMTGHDNSLNNLVQNAIKDERRVSATENEIEEAVTRGAQRTGSVTEALVNGEFKDITGFKTKMVDLEDDKGNTVIDKKTGKPIQVPKQFVTFSENEEDDVQLADIRTTNPEIAKIVATQRSLPGLIGDAYMTDVMNQVRRLGADVNENFVKEAFDIKLAAVIGTAMPNVTMDATAAQELNTLARLEQKEADQAAEKNSKNIVKNIVRGQGVMYLDGKVYDQKNLDKTLKNMGIDLIRRQSIEVAAAFIKESGFKVNLVQREQGAEFGSIDTNTGVITIDIGQEFKEGKGVVRDVMATLPHELIHLLRAESSQAFNELKSFVLKGMQEKGVDIKETLLKQYMNYAQQGAVQNMDISMEDIIARACEQMFTSQEFKDSMQKQLSNGTFAKIKNFVKDILSKLNNVIANIRGTSDTLSWRLADMRDNIAKIWLTQQERITSQAAQEAATEAIRPADQYTAEQTEAARDIVREAMEHPVTHFSINTNKPGVQVQVIKNGLMAVHNLSERSFVSVLEMLGFPMPSIAVIGNQAFTGYGDISVFFGENAVRFAEGSVYNGDAMTPTLGNNRVRNTNDAMDVLHQQPKRGLSGRSDMVQLFTDYIEVASKEAARRKAYQTTEERQQIKEQADALQNEIFDAARRIGTEKYGSDLNNRQLTQSVGMGVLTAAEIMQREQNLTHEDRMQILQDNMDMMLEHAQGVDLTAEDFTTEQYEQMLEFIDVASQLSSGWRMMESKPDMVLDFKNDLKAVLMPDDTPTKIIQQAIDAGIAKEKIYFYPHNNMKARQAAMMELPNVAEGVRFSLRMQDNENVVRTDREAINRDLMDSLENGETQYGEYRRFSKRVTDPDELEMLDGQETVKTYKTMQLIDGKLYPPMAAVVAGSMEDASKLGEWEKATEHPELIKNGNKFTLNKGKGKGSLQAAYNPYMHSSNLMINDQFSGAWNRTNLVTVECEVPASELDSGYHAEFAKDTTGWHSWHTGTVAGQLRNAKGTERQVMLSRWIRPMRIVPDSEVAQHYKELLDGTKIKVPDNVVTPSLLEELKKAGVPIKVTGKVQTGEIDIEVKPKSKTEETGEKGINGPASSKYKNMTLGNDISEEGTSEDTASTKKPKARYVDEENNVRHSFRNAAKEVGLKVTDSGEIQDNRGNTLAMELEGGSVARYSLNSWRKDNQVKIRQMLLNTKQFTEDQVDDWIKNVNDIAKYIADHDDKLDYVADKRFRFRKPNADVYKYTLDASTLCKKRLEYQGTLNAIQKALPNTVLKPGDLIDLANMMREMGHVTPCGICYVESNRRHAGNFSQEFIDNYKKNNPNGYAPTLADLVSTEGLYKLREEHPEVYKAYIAANNRRGSGSVKPVQNRTDYRKDMRYIKQATVDYLNRVGGLRMQSFSDFETPHLIDITQALLDMSAKGLKSQAYTKVPDFAWVFGNTGIKINLSLMGEGNGLDANGNLIFSSVEGMNFDEAMKLRNKYSDNVGTILVGMNNAHIIAAMGDPRIDYIIPFHKSGWSNEELNKMDSLKGYEDFTATQNERNISDGKKAETGIALEDYWDYNRTGTQNAKAYLDLCAERGLIPKFDQFLKYKGNGKYILPTDSSKDSENIRKGYWKLLIDYKMYNNEGVGVEQQAITPDINMEEAMRVLGEYKGGANTLPVAQDVVDRFVDHMKNKPAEEKAPSKKVKGTATSAYGNMTMGNEISEEGNEEDYDSMPKPKARYADEENVRRSLRQQDEDYAKAVANNDMETAQRMVDEAAENAGYVKEGYHGTLNGGFTIFDKKKAHIGGNSGAGFYFSSNQDDSEANYSDVEGADNHFKVMHLVEKIQQYIEDTGENEYAGIPIPEDATDEELEDIAKKMIQGNPQTYHVRLNPGRVYIRDYGKSTNLLENVYDDFDESDYNRDDFDSDEQYEDAVFEGREEHLYQAISDAVYKAIRDVDSNFEIVSNVDYESIISELAMIAQDYDELTWKDVSKVISEQYIDALVDDGEESADASAEITRAIVEAFGFDSIEDREVGTKFNQLKNMSAGDTVHYIMFRPNQIKSVDPVTYDRNKKPIELSQRFNQENNDIRYSKRIAEQDVRQSRRGPDMDINQWMMDLKPWQLRTASERQLLQNYKGLRTKIELQHERIEKTQRQIRELTIRDDTHENKNMIERLKLKLQDQQKALDDLEEQWIEVTSDEGYAKMMKQWYDFAENMIQGKTQEQVAEAIYRMQDTAEAMQKRINETAEELRKLAKDEGVQRGRSIISNNSLNKAAADFRKQYHLDISKQELMDALSKIRLEIHAGEADAASEDVMALAGQIMEHMHGEPSQALKQLRGMTITLSPGQLKELTGSNRSLTELRRELARTGIKVKTATIEEIKSGKKTTLSNSWDELCDMLEGKLTRDVPAEQQIFELMRFIRGEMQAASQPQFDAKEADVINDVWDKALQLKMVTATDPAMQSKLDKMHDYIQQMSRTAAEGADIIDKINSMVGQVIKEGKRAAAYTDSMRQDIARTVEYFDKVARMAQDTARNDHLKEVIENLKSEAAQKLMRTNQEWRDLVERDRKARLQAEDNDVERNKMNTVVKRLAKLMSEPKNEKNIPEHMQGLARELMGILVGNDMSGGRRILQGPKKSLADLQRRLRAWNVRDGAFDINEMPIADDSEEKEMILNNLDTIREAIREWNGRYKGKNNLDTLVQMGKTLTKMQEAVSEIYSYIQAERYISEIDRKILVADAASMVQEGTKGKVHKELTGKLGGAINAMHSAIISGNMTPEYFFRMLDNEGISMLWDGYKEAENRNGLELKKAQDRLAEIAEKHGFKNWDMKQKHQLQLESGRTVTMTTGQLMSLYATWNREQTLGPEMSEHLSKGGFFAEEDTREGIVGKLVQQKRPSTVTPGDMVNVGNMLSDEQRAFVNDIVSYMSKDLSKLGNEASMMAYGMKLYKETYYFPFKMWDGIKSRKSNDAGKAAGANQAFHPSFSKSRMHGANNAIIIGDFMQTATDHIVGMINYATMGLANENLNKVMNYTVMEENGSEQIKRNIRAIFEEAYGKEAGKYLEELKVQLNGGAVKANKDFYDNLISLFRKNAVAGSLSVALQQPLSYLRAGVVMNPKYLAQALGHEWWKGSYEELMKYSGVAVIKDMGKFDMNAGQGARNYITPDGKESKAKKAWDFITDKLTILPSKMDAWTWTRMWVATKLEQKALHPDMDVKSEEFLKMAAKRFNDVMRRTQVYDSTLVRSANMRSDKQFVKGITSFMAEPTLTLNLLADGVRQIKQGKAGGKAALAKAGAAYLMSAVLQAVVKGFAGAGRNPDDDKTALENFLYRFGNSAISELDPLTMIPGYSDIITLMKDSELSDDAWGSIGKMFKAFKNAGGTISNLIAGKGFKEPYREFEDSVAQIVQLFSNLPAKNLMRDARMMYNWFIDQPFASRPNSAAIIKYQAIDSFMNADNLVGVVNKELGDAGYKTTKAAYKDRIKEAEAAGDTETAEAMREYTGLTASDSEKNENRYMQEEMKAGRMTSSEVKAKLRELHPDRNEDSIWWTVDRMEYENATGKEVGTNKYYRLWDAMDGNSASDIGNAIQTMQGHGVDAKSIKSNINSHYKELYLEADASGKVRIRDAMQKAYKQLGLTAGDADKVINKWK